MQLSDWLGCRNPSRLFTKFIKAFPKIRVERISVEPINSFECSCKMEPLAANLFQWGCWPGAKPELRTADQSSSCSDAICELESRDGTMIEIKRCDTGETLHRVEAKSLVGQSLIGLSLQHANFSGMNLKGVDFTRTNLMHANFANSQLQGTLFASSVLSDANFDSANCTGADFTDAIGKKAKFEKVKASGAIFRYAKLGESNFSGADLTGADLSLADLKGNFFEANLSKSDLRGSDLTGANLTNANLTGANMATAKTDGMRMNHTRLDNVIDASGHRLGTPQGFKAKKAAIRPWWQFWAG